jgi:hypothetical protein
MLLTPEVRTRAVTEARHGGRVVGNLNSDRLNMIFLLSAGCRYNALVRDCG